jgi:amino acid permease
MEQFFWKILAFWVIAGLMIAILYPEWKKELKEVKKYEQDAN